jgi:hypothetical protein
VFRRRLRRSAVPKADSKMLRTSLRCRIENPVTREYVWKTMVIDPTEAADTCIPPFVNRPPGSKPYHGHPLLDECQIDGWQFGVITDPFEPDCELGCTIGDAFVEAPDGSRAGLVWMVEDELRFAVLTEPDEDRWGIFVFSVEQPIGNMAQLVEAFTPMVPSLQMLHARYRG